ncbi:IucA/IucC family protein [Halobacterium salinarum]|uniref:IucA/IucC family protein n=1 Tax=Halobacterium salinarum TaxID=2242 RepID=UPI001F3AEA58|nr:IucA/IucC family siderophore biosynthesis protein [Halobacterium salinarum]MCF2164910.1 IucA/IucC family siderophore biosynthesis protein [Halobacterium salinarum]MCF2168996.1 IucA/IucC family siderophore biosynthesis protein [Halobacterium salinarum]MCF2237720.1 IucA/IucC family siderophore biosynthesis protein [Halobacterium salinarum]WJK64905.1 IucA/IucC family siderophore biosynthesis protein [Halobacterium salinarum]
MNTYEDTLQDAVTADTWATVERSLLAKLLREFTYEELLAPERTTDTDRGGRYRLVLPAADDADAVRYRFEAEERLMDTLRVFPDTIERAPSGADSWATATDPIRFLLDARETLDATELTTGHLIREYRNTLLADAHIEARSTPESFADRSYAEYESEMTGHPWITFNKGRLGWDYEDYRDYAPERRQTTTIGWLAVRTDRVTFETVSGLTPTELLRGELGDQYDDFMATLADRGLDPQEYTLLPVHDYQWETTIASLYAGELAADAIVPLGDGTDSYLPGQSVRTLFNVDAPEKHNVKLPMKIRNTLVWRGLPGDRTEAAPRVTEYITDIRDGDPFLRDDCELVLPGEVAGVNYDHPAFSELEDNAYQYDELLGAVWRESITDAIPDSQQAVTLAALLHEADGTAVISEFVERSPLELSAWLTELFDTLLPPLLHYLYRYGTVFSPHGENTIVILDEEFVPTRLGVKDFVDDVNISDQPLPELADLDADLRRVLRSEPPDGLCQFYVCGLFVGVFRYLSDVLTAHHGYDETEFWTQVRDAITAYQAEFPGLSDRFETFDLLQPTFTKLCLNRNRLTEEGYSDTASRPHAAEHGTVTNALHEVAGDAGE